MDHLSEAIGQPIGIIIPPEQKEEMREILESLKRDERVQHFETVRLRKDGRKIDVSVSMSLVRDSDGSIIAASAIASASFASVLFDLTKGLTN